MRLRTKLLLGFLVTPLIFVMTAIGGYLGLSTIRDDVVGLQNFVQTTDLMSQSAAEIATLPHPEDIEVGVIRSRPKPGETPVIVSLLNERVGRARIQLRSLKRLAHEPRSQAAVSEALDGVESYRVAALELAEGLATRGVEAARGRERQRAVERFEALEPLVRQYTQTIGTESRRALQELGNEVKSETESQARNSLLLFLLLTLLLGYLVVTLSTRDLLRLHQATQRVKAGDLDITLPVRGRDEIGELSAAFNDMTRRLREIYYDLENEVQTRTEALRQRERELYEAQKLAAIGRLSAGVAHELGGPLTIIANAAEGLQERAREARFEDDELTEDFPDYLELIESEAFRLKKVVRRLLDYARPKAPEMAPIDLRQVVASAVDLARLDPRARRVPLRFEEEGGALALEGDADRLQEATLNLIFNALDACRGEGEVRIELAETEEEAILRVSDDGYGITPEAAAHIFEPFYTTKPEGAGTGLGLALVLSSAKAHQGRIEVESEGAGKGATFELHLPRRRAPEPE